MRKSRKPAVENFDDPVYFFIHLAVKLGGGKTL